MQSSNKFFKYTNRQHLSSLVQPQDIIPNQMLNTKTYVSASYRSFLHLMIV